MNIEKPISADLANVYFSTTYREAREKFLAVCNNENARITNYFHPEEKCADGGVLATDVARFGPDNAKKIALFICGTHGLEAAPGAATFIQWITQGGPQSLSADMAVLFVHAINPFGWAHFRRGDEGNVDVNRNCFERNTAVPHNEAYRELHNCMVSDELSDASLENSIRAFRRFCDEYGLAKGFQGWTAGQYEFPNGISYGGEEESWSYKTLKTILAEHFQYAEKSISIDWHTGIGEYGDPFIILNGSKGSEKYIRACRYWSEEYVHTDDFYDGQIAVEHTGLVMTAVEELKNLHSNAEMISAVVEWGTYPIDEMFKSLLIDRRLQCLDPNGNLHDEAALRRRLRESFNPTDPIWRRSILTHADRIYRQSIEGLAAW